MRLGIIFGSGDVRKLAAQLQEMLDAGARWTMTDAPFSVAIATEPPLNLAA